MSDDFDRELQISFLDEARELLNDSEKCFLKLEHANEDPRIIEEIFRLAHNLKGSSKAVGFDELGVFTHLLESLLLKIKQGELPITSAIVSLLLACNDFLVKSIDCLKADPKHRIEDPALRETIEIYLNKSPSTVVPVQVQSHPKPEVDPTAAAAKPGQTQAQAADETIRVNLSRIDQLMTTVGELVILQTVMSQQRENAGSTLMQKTITEMAKIVKELQALSMNLRLLPLKATFQKMQRVVRDTSKALGKEIDLELEGEETELDKTLIEALGDPLVHLIRNGVDHGIEGPDERVQKGKPARGTLVLSARQTSNQIVIEIRDDGRGLDAKGLIKKARQKGLIDETTELSDEQAYQLIFAAGFSTRENISDVSGRGVGMDVVKTNVAGLNGRIDISTVLGQGTCFRLALPMTLAIVDGMVVLVGDEKYVVPSSQIAGFSRVTDDNVHTAGANKEVMTSQSGVLPLYNLTRLLKRESIPSYDGVATLMVAQNINGDSFALRVDEVICQQQVVIKPLGNEITGLPGIVGASILSDGKAAFILDLFELIDHAKKENRPAPIATPPLAGEVA